jgi:hypothetical protein
VDDVTGAQPSGEGEAGIGHHVNSLKP